MRDIDDKIKEALRAEDAELLDLYGGEQSMLEMAIGVLRGHHRWLVLLTWLLMIAFTGLTIVSAIQFFNAESTRAMIAWSMGFVLGILTVSLLKIWFWMEMNKNAVTREVKRVELQLARLSEAIRNR